MNIFHVLSYWSGNCILYTNLPICCAVNEPSSYALHIKKASWALIRSLVTTGVHKHKRGIKYYIFSNILFSECYMNLVLNMCSAQAQHHMIREQLVYDSGTVLQQCTRSTWEYNYILYILFPSLQRWAWGKQVWMCSHTYFAYIYIYATKHVSVVCYCVCFH